MKINKLALWCAVLPAVLFAQQKTTKNDTTKTKIIQLNTVIVTGKSNTDPVLTTVKTDLQKKSSTT